MFIMSEPETSDMQRDMDELVTQNRVLAREVITLTDSHDTIIKALVVFQGLLAQFFSPSVRVDFLSGKFDVNVNTKDVLSSLDVFRTILLSYPNGSRGRSTCSADAVEFVSRLLSKDKSEPVSLQRENLAYRQSFCEWRNYLNVLMSSPHWETRSKNILAADVDTNAAATCYDVLESQWEGFDDIRDDNVPKLENGGKYSTPRTRRERIVPFKSRGVAGDSQSDYDATTDDDSCDGKVDRGCVGPTQQSKQARQKDIVTDRTDLSLASAIQYLRMPKEVVPPPKFDLKAGISLRRFLEQYERYFCTKFDGTDRDKAQHLQQFLLGSVRSAYDAIGGPQLRYTKLKPKLLEWYCTERVSVSQKKFDEFQNVKMTPNESSTVYALRLERIALQAFPGSLSDRERHLCQKFRRTVVVTLKKKFDSAASNLAVLGERRLTWDNMKRVAEAHDRLIRDQQFNESVNNDSDEDRAISVWYSRPSETRLPNRRNVTTVPRSTTRYEQQGARPKTSFAGHTVFRNRRDTPGSPPAYKEKSRGTLVCDWCNRSGHSERNCWAKHGQCTLCGDQAHKRDECRRYDSRTRSIIRPMCSLCGGSHIDHDCNNNDATNLNL